MGKAIEKPSKNIKLFYVPKPPINFLNRPKEVSALKKALLSNATKAVVITGIAHTTPPLALQGMGGIGKSVLASILAHSDDLDICKEFPDGIIWLTLGQEPNLQQKQSALIKVFGITVSFLDVENGKEELQKLLEDKSCLIILDDLWDVRHFDAFNVLGKRCRVLITTRNLRIAQLLGGISYNLNLLSDDEAKQLLAKWAQKEVSDLPCEAIDIINECGKLPLAISMIGASLRGRKSDRWINTLLKLRERDLTEIGTSFSNYPYPTLFRAIEVSLKSLPSKAQACYLDFAVFQEDTPIPESVLTILWKKRKLKRHEPKELIDTFIDHSLVQQNEMGLLTLHDLLVDYVVSQTQDLMSLHKDLVEAYRMLCSNGWASGPDDGYFFYYLPKHLSKAGLQIELYELLLDFDWLQAKCNTTSPIALLKDYELAEEPSISLVKGAIQLSIYAIAKEKNQLAGQLIGRLQNYKKSKIAKLIRQTQNWRDVVWFCPQTASLTKPDGSLRANYVGHTGDIFAVVITHDGKYAISASEDKTLILWDLQNSERLSVFQEHSGSILDVVVTTDGRYAISASADSTLKLWDLKERVLVLTYVGHKYPVVALAVTLDNNQIISASSDNTINVWDLQSGILLKTYSPISIKYESFRFFGGDGNHFDGKSQIIKLLLTADGNGIISIYRDYKFKYLNFHTGEEQSLNLRVPQNTYPNTNEELYGGELTIAIAVPNSKQILTFSKFCAINLWELIDKNAIHLVKSLQKGKARHIHLTDFSVVRALAITPDAKFVCATSHDNTVSLFDLQTGHFLRSFGRHTGLVTAIAVTSDSKQAISASTDNTLKLWDLHAQKVSNNVKDNSWRHDIAITPDDKYAIVGSFSGFPSLRQFNLITGELVGVFEESDDGILKVAVTPDGTQVISISYGGLIQQWDLNNRNIVRTIATEDGFLNTVAISPDSRKAVITSDIEGIKVLDLQTEKTLFSIEDKFLNSISITPDSKYIIIAHENILEVLYLSNGEVILTYEGHRVPVYDGYRYIADIAITSDSKFAVSVANDTCHLWELLTGNTLAIFKAPGRDVTAIRFTSDNSRIIFACADHAVYLFDLQSKNIITSFYGDSALTSCAITSDDKIVLVSESSGQLHFLKLIK
ncbi:MAG: NB-ARC domain-containing protein [Blastocatellia bacterium]